MQCGIQHDASSCKEVSLGCQGLALSQCASFPAENSQCMAQVGGDIVPEGSTFQGWPAEMLFQQQSTTEAKAESNEVCIDISAEAQKPSKQE